MAALYASALLVCVCSLALGQAAMTLCGWREWSWLSPAAGLALVCALAWATVRLPPGGEAAAIAVAAASVLAGAFLYGRVSDWREALRLGVPVALIGLIAGSLPFILEGRAGILGTGFNPDMSQHLLAASHLGAGESRGLIEQGYPLGPHAVAVALEDGLGVGLVQTFSGLTVAAAVLAPLTALALVRRASAPTRILAALVVGLPYMVASYYAQGAFKELIEALFILAFFLGLREVVATPGHPRPLAGVPLALLAAGSLYVYSFPGLAWIVAGAAVWAAFVLIRAGRERFRLMRAALRPALFALLVFAILAAPELGRMLDFRDFETFDPTGPGLGNLFGQISPFEALGFWPSGDFRLTPGDGVAPAILYYLGVVAGLVLLAYGALWACRRSDTVLPAALLGGLVIWTLARATGTPYQAAKAVAVMAPLALAVIVLPLASLGWRRLEGGGLRQFLPPVLTAGFVLTAAACSALAITNAPVGPGGYAPELTGLRPMVDGAPTWVSAPEEMLADEHGVPFIAWELRGARVCIAPQSREGGPPPTGVRYVITTDERRTRPPFQRTHVRKVAGAWWLWRVSGRVASRSDCPLIAVREARQGEDRE
ncbi:MAG TPA: hypothetical protein VKA89_06900 [Solirubrobacterales bacterium]|nr:hypothetical protein [Solirubrobacterales bacterium]